MTTIDLSSTGIARIAPDAIVTTDPDTGLPMTLTQVRALDDGEWGAWRNMDPEAYRVAYAVHVRGDWDAIVKARTDRRWAERRAATLADMERLAATLPQVEPATDWTLVGPTVEVVLPPRFYDDHVARDCHPGVVVRRMKSGVRVVVDAAAFDDLLSDARYYCDAAEWGSEYLGLAASARGAVRRLVAVGRPG
jgi:hypothetical protein